MKSECDVHTIEITYTSLGFRCDLFPPCGLFVVIECLDDERQRMILIRFALTSVGFDGANVNLN